MSVWLTSVVLASALATADAGVKPLSSSDVRAQMRSSFQGLLALQPYLATPSAFSDKKNEAAIVEGLKELGSVKHAFPRKMAEEEPGVAAISHLFARYLDDTKARFTEGDFEYARYRLRTITGLCLGCHGQMKSEEDFVDVNKKVEGLELSPLERADYLAATRQFELAMLAYGQVLTPTPEDERGYFEFLRALRHALSLSVRVKQDPEVTFQLLSGLSDRSDLPPFLLDYIRRWKKDVSQWQRDSFSPEKATLPQLLKKARSLLSNTRASQTVLPDEHQEIAFLRATGYLHEALRREPTSKLRAEALYLLGVCYAELQDPSLWELDTLYLETCVRENPHTPIAQKCLKRLTDRLFVGYTGSRGTQLPEDEVARLAELRRLASPEGK